MHFLYFLIAIGLVILLCSVIYSIRHQRRLAQLKGFPEEEFVRYFSERGVPPNISQMVFTVYRKKARSPNFTPSPDMSLDEVFNQAPEDIDDDAKYILNELNLPSVPEDIRDTWTGGEIKTISDLTMWIGWVHTAGSR
jgi:hypothetical protein